MKIKFNWGFGVLIVIVVFMAFILVLVFKCSDQRVDLVNPAYYEQELKYDGQMQKESNAQQLTEPLNICYDQAGKLVVLNYPANDGKQIAGTIHFFKPDNATLDFTIPITFGQNHFQNVAVNKIMHGWWNVKVDWEANSKPYYFEQKLLIN